MLVAPTIIPAASVTLMMLWSVYSVYCDTLPVEGFQTVSGPASLPYPATAPM
jgi:hypothetical protein